MLRSDPVDLRAHVERIWRAGVAAVMPERLIRSHVRVDGNWLLVGEESIDLGGVGRIAVVGAGKAAGAMAVALEDALGPKILAEKHVCGWVNVPADCVVPTKQVKLHAARPAGVNEPRPEGIAGTRQVLKIASSLGPRDLCFCLLTGGGSALLVAPVAGISLDGKIRITQLMSAAGANIEQLNTVRRQLSRVKGGGLAQACRAGRLMSLIISDVLGDSLETIASGPTKPSAATTADALAVLAELDIIADPTIDSVVRFLRTKQGNGTTNDEQQSGTSSVVTHHLLANNALAVDAAGVEAERLGYSHAMIAASQSEGAAEEVGRHLASLALRMRVDAGPDCLISGGEPTVKLVQESQRGRGGRNQQLALAALAELGDCQNIALLSAGTDGEDGPTAAAGAVVTNDIVTKARSLELKPYDYLARNDAYSFFQSAGGLFLTGPTHTNVCDLRVVAVRQRGIT